jgi:hypothetical protein
MLAEADPKSNAVFYSTLGIRLNHQWKTMCWNPNRGHGTLDGNGGTLTMNPRPIWQIEVAA